MTTNTKNVNMGKVTPDQKAAIDTMVHATGHSNKDFMLKMVEVFKANGLEGLGLSGNAPTVKPDTLNPEQKVMIENAVKFSGGTVESFMIDASIDRAQQVIKLSQANPEKLKNTPNAAVIRIHNAVLTMIDSNKSADNWYEQTMITQGTIAKITGANRPAINRYLEDNKTLIDNHNEAMKFDKNQNVRAAMERRRLENKEVS